MCNAMVIELYAGCWMRPPPRSAGIGTRYRHSQRLSGSGGRCRPLHPGGCRQQTFRSLVAVFRIGTRYHGFHSQMLGPRYFNPGWRRMLGCSALSRDLFIPCERSSSRPLPPKFSHTRIPLAGFDDRGPGWTRRVSSHLHKYPDIDPVWIFGWVGFPAFLAS